MAAPPPVRKPAVDPSLASKVEIFKSDDGVNAALMSFMSDVICCTGVGQSFSFLASEKANMCDSFGEGIEEQIKAAKYIEATCEVSLGTRTHT